MPAGLVAVQGCGGGAGRGGAGRGGAVSRRRHGRCIHARNGVHFAAGNLTLDATAVLDVSAALPSGSSSASASGSAGSLTLAAPSGAVTLGGSLRGLSAPGQGGASLALDSGSPVNLSALQELELTQRDKWLIGAQLGADWALGDQTNLRFGAGVYAFQNVEGVRETNPLPADASTVPYYSSQYPSGARLRGKTLIRLNDPTNTAGAPVWGLASKFRPINVTAALTLTLFAQVRVKTDTNTLLQSESVPGFASVRIENLAEEFKDRLAALRLSVTK